MKRLLYVLALLLAVVTAVGYVVGKGWEEEKPQTTAKLSFVQQFKQWSKLAKQGDPDAQYQLGLYYEKQRSDFLNAQKWYRVAATKGDHAPSQYKLAMLYMNGLGVENDLPEAMKWFRKAAFKDEVRAQFFLGIAHRDGWERKPDFIEAYKWFLLSARGQEKVLAEDPRFNPKTALSEMDGEMSRFDRAEAQKRMQAWISR